MIAVQAPIAVPELPNAAAERAHPVRLSGVCKRWRADLPPILERLDLTLEQGTISWVGGRNGAGKTTLLRIAAGLIEPERGSVEICGLRARDDRARYQGLVSFLPAGDRGLYARLTVRRQLEFCARISLLGSAAVPAAVTRAVGAFDLAELVERRVDRMSMGQRQRLRIAMTFLTEPQVVLLDEPLTSLDSRGAALLQDAIRELRARGGTVLWCSPTGEHLDVEFDARWLIEHGRLVSA